MNAVVSHMPVLLDTGSPDTQGRLLLVGDWLVCILVWLSAETHDDPQLHQKWFMEVGFGPCSIRQDTPRLFGTLEDAKAWVEERMGLRSDKFTRQR
ncbi:conserved hypothetical protein [Methylobacterium nodulans ORS 2060]|uniref:Uncharacterized protein n=1 Tax=Methylobacterium nodulans (strain LMG 21967 / CNCM I-2342 / ORS 2060) TaxID=460265 RepID=B8ILU8_METNO|nr:conserved hypothetical protein [Methylobacterium nodulans ORS 2060]